MENKVLNDEQLVDAAGGFGFKIGAFGYEIGFDIDLEDVLPKPLIRQEFPTPLIADATVTTIGGTEFTETTFDGLHTTSANF